MLCTKQLLAGGFSFLATSLDRCLSWYVGPSRIANALKPHRRIPLRPTVFSIPPFPRASFLGEDMSSEGQPLISLPHRMSFCRENVVAMIRRYAARRVMLPASRRSRRVITCTLLFCLAVAALLHMRSSLYCHLIPMSVVLWLTT